MIYAGITTLIWAAAFLFTQFAQESFSSQSIGLLRYLAASGGYAGDSGCEADRVPEMERCSEVPSGGRNRFCLLCDSIQ